MLLSRVTLRPWPLAFWRWPSFIYSTSHARPAYQFWLSYDYRVTELWIRSHFRYRERSLRMRCVTWPITGWRSNMVHIFEIHDPNLSIHFLSLSVRRRLSLVIGENSVYPILKATKWLRMNSITWPVHRGSPKTTHNSFFDPELFIHYTTFMGLRRQLR